MLISSLLISDEICGAAEDASTGPIFPKVSIGGYQPGHGHFPFLAPLQCPGSAGTAPTVGSEGTDPFSVPFLQTEKCSAQTALFSLPDLQPLTVSLACGFLLGTANQGR